MELLDSLAPVTNTACNRGKRLCAACTQSKLPGLVYSPAIRYLEMGKLDSLVNPVGVLNPEHSNTAQQPG